MFNKKLGKRIKPCHEKFVRKFAVHRIVPVFLLVFGLVNLPAFLSADFKAPILDILSQFKVSMIIGFIVSSCACVCSCYWFWRYRHNKFRGLQHCQMIAEMVLENHWYDTKKVGKKNKEKIVNFPKIYYRNDNGILKISVSTRMGKYQEQLVSLEKRLEIGLFSELIDKTMYEGYLEYSLLYDVIGSRIGIEEAKAENGRLKLMNNVYWEFDDLPHMLIVGGTGGGKTYFLLTIIKALLETNAKLYILDPKNSDLADLGTLIPDVYYKTDDIINMVNEFYDKMMYRAERIKSLPKYKTGENYAYAGLKPHFLIFDEYVAFMSVIGRAGTEVGAKLSQIAMLGRQLGFFIILACQRADAKNFSDGMRDQFNFRVALGKVSDQGYHMAFGETTKQFFLKPIKGRGYFENGGNVISEFYTPLVPRGYNFLSEIGKIVQGKRPTAAPTCEAKVEPDGEVEGLAAKPQTL